MGYVGNQSTNAYSSLPAKQDLTGATGTSLTLSHAVAGPESIDLFINNVRQEPTTAYSVSDTTVTLTGSVVATDDIYVVYNGLALQTIVPPDGSVTNAKIDTMAASKLTGALPAIDGSALTGIASPNVKEIVPLLPDGVAVTVSSGTYTPQNVTSHQAINTSWADLTGSVITYTPPTGTTHVIYEFQYHYSRHDNHPIHQIQLYIGGSAVNHAKGVSGASYAEGDVVFRWIIPIGGSADANTGRQATWTSGKELKLRVRDYAANNECDIHRTHYWNGSEENNQFIKPRLQLTAIG